MRLLCLLLKNACPPKPVCCVQPKPPKQGYLSKAFTKYLIITNITTSGLLMGISDFTQQKIEQYQHRPILVGYDYQRTRNLMIVGLGHGVFHHYFYSWMDRAIPYTNMRGVLYKILLDQFVAGPVCITFFFICMGLLNTGKLETGLTELKTKFLFVFQVDWMVWPPAQFINFYFMPLRYRVLYINTVTMMYNVFLSYAKHYDQPKPLK